MRIHRREPAGVLPGRCRRRVAGKISPAHRNYQTICETAGLRRSRVVWCHTSLARQRKCEGFSNGSARSRKGQAAHQEIRSRKCGRIHKEGRIVFWLAWPCSGEGARAPQTTSNEKYRSQKASL